MSLSKKIGLVLVLVFFAFGVGFSASSDFVIESYVGKVRISPDIGKTWKNAKVDMKLTTKDLISTAADSTCYVAMPKLGSFYITENSYVYVSKLTSSKKSILVPVGSIFYKLTQKVKKGGYFKIETTVAVATVRGTEFSITSDSENLKVEVAKGEVTLRRNIAVPDYDKLDDETKKLLEVSVTKNQAIELTMDENKHLEKLLASVKGNMAEYKRILIEENAAMKSKIVLQKKARELFKMLDEYEKSLGNEDADMDELMNQFKNRNEKK